MKKLVIVSAIAVGLSGSMSASMPDVTGWQSVANASATLVKDKQVQQRAQQSVRKIVMSLQEFVSYGMNKIAENSDKQGKANLKEVLNRVEKLLGKYTVAFEAGDFDALSEKTQQEITQSVQELVMICMPLMAMISQADVSFSKDDAFVKSLRMEFFNGIRTMVAQVNKDLK